MSTYKEPIEYLQLAVNSILNQTYRDIEFVIIIDDPQNTAVKNFLTVKQSQDNRIKIIENEKNIGLVKSLNKGLRYCTGQYIARMDADDISLPDRLQNQLEYMENNRLDIVGGAYERFVNANENGEVLAFPFTHTDILERLKKGNCVPHPAWLVKSEVFELCNGYRDINCCEDYDFIIRAVNKGFKVGNYPECVLRYRYNPNSISRKGFAEQNVITEFLSMFFAEEKELTMEEYKTYKNSSRCKKKIQKEAHLGELKMTYKDCTNKLNKLFVLMKICVNPLFWKKTIQKGML